MDSFDNLSVWMYDCGVFVYNYAFSHAYSGPFDSTLSSELALNNLAAYRSQLEALKEEENTIFLGLGYSETEQPPSKSIRTLEKV